MKRIPSILLIICLTLGLCSCAQAEQDNNAEMYIEPAQLTEEEKNIAELFGSNTSQTVFDFVLNDDVHSIQVNVYRLSDGKWESEIGGGGQVFTDTSGRIALQFGKLAEGIRIAIQSENGSDITSYEREAADEFANMGYANSILPDKVKVSYGEEIPLAIQVITSKNEIISYAVDYFKNPEEYEKFDYEGVFVVTICFSQQPLT